MKFAQLCKLVLCNKKVIELGFIFMKNNKFMDAQRKTHIQVQTSLESKVSQLYCSDIDYF